MKSLSAAIAWEIWRKNRWGFGLLGALVLLCALLNSVLLRLFPDNPESEWLIPANVILMVFSYVALLAIFSHTEEDAKGSFGFPLRMFALPVRTGALVNRLILLGVTAVILVMVAWTNLLRSLGIDRMPIHYFLLLAATGLVLFQALVWSLASFPKTRALLLTALFFGLIYLGSLPFLPDPAWSRLEKEVTLSMLGVLSFSYLAALRGLQAERCGGWREWDAGHRLIRGFRQWRRHSAAFASPAAGQVWFEWRRNGLVPLSSFLALQLLIFVTMVRPVMAEGVTVLLSVVFGLNIFFVLPLWAILAGLTMARDGCSMRLPLSAFTAIRPISSGELVIAKLKTGGLLSLGASFLMVLYFFGLLVIDTEWRNMDRAFHNGPIVFLLFPVGIVVMTWHLMIGALPVWLTGRAPGFPWSLLVLIAGYFLAGNAGRWFYLHPESWEVLRWLLLIGWLMKLSVAAWAFRAGIRRDLLPSRFVWIYSGIWFAGSIVLVVSAYILCAGTSLPKHLIALIVSLLVPLARVALSPLALDWNRHR